MACLHQYLNELPIREFEKTEHYEDAYTRAWFDYCRSVSPQSVRKASPNVDLTCQRSSAASSSTKWVPSARGVNIGKLPQLSLLKEIWGNNYAHVILTAEADSLPTDEKELLDDHGFVGCQSSRSNDLSVHARIDSSGYIRLLWESDEERNGHEAIFEVKFGEKTERTTTKSCERSAEQLFDTLEPVALAMEGSDLGPTEDPFEPTARCINDTKKRQLVTRSGLPR